MWRRHAFDPGEVTGRLSLASCWRKHWLSPSGKIDSIFKRALYTEAEIQKILCILTIHPFWPRPNAFWVMYITIFEEGFIYINFFLIYQLRATFALTKGSWISLFGWGLHRHNINKAFFTAWRFLKRWFFLHNWTSPWGSERV